MIMFIYTWCQVASVTGRCSSTLAWIGGFVQLTNPSMFLFFTFMALNACEESDWPITDSFGLWWLPNFAQESTTLDKHVADTAHLTITTLTWTAGTVAPCPQTAPISSTSAVRVPLRRHTLIGMGSTTHKHSTENRQRCSSQGDSCLLPSTCHRVAIWVSKISIRKMGPKVCIQLDSPFI